MGDKFTIQVSTGDLSSAETFLGDLGRNIEEEGTKLGNLPGKAASWTGKTATTLKAEMTRVAGQMKQAPEHFNTAKTAIATFRGKIEDAQTKTLPDLNRRWNDTITTYDGAVTSANQQLSRDLRPYQHMPPEDVGTARTDLTKTRDKAVTDAAGVRDTAQKKIQGEYDTLIHDLETAASTCGSALNSAVLAAVPASVITAYLAGGGMGPGTLDANFDKVTKDARQKLTGDDSLAGKADDLRAGDELGKSVKDKTKKGEKLTPEEIAYLKANAGNQAFVQGFMQSMGPEALAALSYRTLIDVQSGGSDDDEKKNGQALMSALTDVYTTGSNIQVDDGKGGQRYLMDDGWLNNFSPKKGLPDVPGYSGVQDNGYEPGVLLPFLTKPLSENFSKVVGDRFLRDYEDAKKNGNSEWIYRNYNNPITGKPVFNVLFDRMADHPAVANDLMTAHTKTFLDFMAGKDKYLIGEVNDEPNVTGQLNKMLDGAVNDPKLDAQHQSNADYIVASMGQYLGDPANKEPKFIKGVLPAVGNILTNDRYFTGQVMSVATPFAPGMTNGGFPDYTRDPKFGFLMDPNAWKQLQQEALRDPDNANKIITKTADWLQHARTTTEGAAWTEDDGKATTDFSIAGLDLYQQEAVRKFLGDNLLAAKDDLTAEMDKRLADAGKGPEMGKAVVGKLFEWATDPKAAPKDIGTMALDKTIDLATGAWTNYNEDQIKAEYKKQLDGLTKASQDSFVNPSFWDKANGSAGNLAGNYEEGRTPPGVWAEQAGQPKGAPAHHYTGNPLDYVGKKSEYEGGGQVMTDDFLTYDASGKPTGTVPVKDMNSLQREAYNNWLKDPAVQQFLDQDIDAVDKAVDRAGK